jgi:hypothetical protein
MQLHWPCKSLWARFNSFEDTAIQSQNIDQISSRREFHYTGMGFNLSTKLRQMSCLLQPVLKWECKLLLLDKNTAAQRFNLSEQLRPWPQVGLLEAPDPGRLLCVPATMSPTHRLEDRHMSGRDGKGSSRCGRGAKIAPSTTNRFTTTRVVEANTL